METISPLTSLFYTPLFLPLLPPGSRLASAGPPPPGSQLRLGELLWAQPTGVGAQKPGFPRGFCGFCLCLGLRVKAEPAAGALQPLALVAPAQPSSAQSPAPAPAFSGDFTEDLWTSPRTHRVSVTVTPVGEGKSCSLYPWKPLAGNSVTREQQKKSTRLLTCVPPACLGETQGERSSSQRWPGRTPVPPSAKDKREKRVREASTGR